MLTGRLLRGVLVTLLVCGSVAVTTLVSEDGETEAQVPSLRALVLEVISELPEEQRPQVAPGGRSDQTRQGSATILEYAFSFELCERDRVVRFVKHLERTRKGVTISRLKLKRKGRQVDGELPDTWDGELSLHARQGDPELPLCRYIPITDIMADLDGALAAATVGDPTGQAQPVTYDHLELRINPLRHKNSITRLDLRVKDLVEFQVIETALHQNLEYFEVKKARDKATKRVALKATFDLGLKPKYHK